MLWNQHFSVVALQFFPATTFLFALTHLSKDQVVQSSDLSTCFFFPAAQTKIIFIVLDFSLSQQVFCFSFWVQHLPYYFNSWKIPHFIAATSAFQHAVVPYFVFSGSKNWLIFIWVNNYSTKYFSIFERLTGGSLFPERWPFHQVWMTIYSFSSLTLIEVGCFILWQYLTSLPAIYFHMLSEGFFFLMLHTHELCSWRFIFTEQ